MRLTIAYSKIKKRNLVLINNDTHQRETVSERPIRPPLKWTTIPQNHNFEKISFKVLTVLKNQQNSCKRKIFAKVLQLLLSLYNLFILPKIPCKIVFTLPISTVH